MSSPDALLPFFGPGTDGDRFEAFCHDLLARTPEFADVRRWGVSGDKQDGFDVLASQAGDEWGFQCKREKEFGPQKVRDAIAEATRPVAQGVILLARPATAGARTTAEDAGWKTWDATDLSQRVRALPTESGIQLVRAHFGNDAVKRFLGIEFDLPWTSLGDFFEPFLQSSRLFTHDHVLAGRVDELQALVDFASGDAWVAIVSGRGGIGKSRLVLEAGRRLEAEGTAVRVVDPDRPVRPEHVQALPASDSVLLVVDDAHRRDDLAALTRFVEAARSSGRSVRLLLTTRPYGLDALRSSVINGGADVSDIKAVPPLDDLSADTMRTIARAALGPDLAGDSLLVQRLVGAAGDSPLVLSLGATLVRRGQIDPGRLRGHDEFRQTILMRFQDEAVGSVAGTVPPAEALETLHVTAAAGPLNTESDATVEAAAAIAGLKPTSFRRALGALEAAGVLVRRGRQVRVSPDVLSDHILEAAALLPSGGSTGYAKEVFDALAAHAGPTVLRNLAELDWRRRRADSPTDLLSDTWASIEWAFRHGDAAERVRILQLVRPAAYYLPARVLALCRLAIRAPVADEDEEQRGYGPTQESVLMELPELLKRVAFTLKVLPDALDLLWDLSQQEAAAALRPYPKSAQDVLVGLAKPGPYRKHRWHHIVLDAAERWAAQQAAGMSTWNGDPDALPTFAASRVIAPTLDRSVDLSWSDGHVFYLDRGWPRANMPVVRFVRRRALRLLEQYALEAGPAGAMAVVAPLADHVKNPTTFQGPTDPEVLRAFESESRWALAILARLIEAYPDPVLADIVWRRLHWFASRGPSGLRRRAVRRLRCRIQAVPDWDLVRVLQRDEDRWVGRERIGDEDPDRAETADSHTDHRKRGEEEQEAAARAYLARGVEPQRAAVDLTDRLTRMLGIETWLTTSGDADLPRPWTFFFTLGRLDPAYARLLSVAVFETTGEAYGPVIAALTAGARRAGAALDQLRSLARGTDPERLAAAQALHSAFRSGEPTAEEWGLLQELLGDPHPDVLAAAVRTWRGTLHTASETARPMLLTIAPGNNQTAGLELFQTVEYRLDDLTGAETEHLMAVVRDLPSIEDSTVLSFLKGVAEADPEAVFDLLASRVQRESDALTALPFQIDEPLFAQTPDALRADFLSRAIQLYLDTDESESSYPARLLVSTLANGFPAVVMSAVQDILAGDVEVADIALWLLRDLPERFPFEFPDAVRSLFDAAEEGGGLSRRGQAEEALRMAARSGTRSRQIGSPCERDIWQRDQARAVAEGLHDDPRLQAFYLSLADAASTAIDRDMIDDSEDRVF